MSRIKEIAGLIQGQNPDVQLYWTIKRDAIGYWAHGLGRVQILVGELLNGAWAPIPELLVNGEPLHKPEDWEPIPEKELR